MTRAIHAFADWGVESHCLNEHFDVTRVGLDPTPNGTGQVVKADATDIPAKDGSFYFGLFHPPCQAFSKMTPDKSKHPNLITDARREAERLCDYWVIENVPQAPLENAVTLDGRMFEGKIAFPRAFESNFEIPPLSRSHRSAKLNWGNDRKLDWAKAKGYPNKYSNFAMKNNAIPRQFLEYILSHLPR